MSLLSNPDALPQALWVVYRAIVPLGGKHEQLAEGLCDSELGKNTIHAALAELGRLKMVEPASIPAEPPDLQAFRVRLREAILSSPDAADLAESLAWWLSLDPGSVSFGSWLEAEKFQLERLGRKLIPNDVQWQNFTRWALFLGFAWQSPVRGREAVIYPDLTEALRDLWASRRGEVPLEICLAEGRTAWPVLDGGSLRLSFDGELGMTLSPTLSHALLCLSEEGCVNLIEKADANKRCIKAGATERWISHLEFRGGCL
ncbi:hypothetical protein [Calidithermus chliarophilus]|uniref:hypothetical protein n=1 Tax=Calidithermus chliarophilus TaxID=52023 RepID=UPI0003F5F332|nr:hypothetical protein [Calidithermus chliarophilus]